MNAPPTPAAGLFRLPRAIIGIDPGGVWTGLALRARGNRYLGHRIVIAPGAESPIGVGPVYFAAIRAAVVELSDVWFAAHPESGPPGFAVEDLGRPGGFDIAQRDGKKERKRRLIDPMDLMAVSATWGAVTASYPDAIPVPRDGHGAQPLATYPPELVSDGERAARHAEGMLRSARKNADVNHARSAWDVARVGELLAQVRAARRP